MRFSAIKLPWSRLWWLTFGIVFLCLLAGTALYTYRQYMRYLYFAEHDPGRVFRSAWLEPDVYAEQIRKHQIRTVINLCESGEKPAPSHRRTTPGGRASRRQAGGTHVSRQSHLVRRSSRVRRIRSGTPRSPELPNLDSLLAWPRTNRKSAGHLRHLDSTQDRTRFAQRDASMAEGSSLAHRCFCLQLRSTSRCYPSCSEPCQTSDR